MPYVAKSAKARAPLNTFAVAWPIKLGADIIIPLAVTDSDGTADHGQYDIILSSSFLCTGFDYDANGILAAKVVKSDLRLSILKALFSVDVGSAKSADEALALQSNAILTAVAAAGLLPS